MSSAPTRDAGTGVDADRVAETDPVYEVLTAYVGKPYGPDNVARDPVNEAMIRHWCDAMGDPNPIYTDPQRAAVSTHGGIVAPPQMLQVWNMPGLSRSRTTTTSEPSAAQEVMQLVADAGYGSVVATNCEQQYHRYLRPGDLLTVSTVLESVSTCKKTALGEGYFVTTRQSYHDQHGEPVGEMLFRILLYRPSAEKADSAASAASAAGTAAARRVRPAISRDTAFFWDGAARGELRIQRCTDCGLLRHPPGPGCPACQSLSWDYQVAAGTGTVYSHVTHHHPPVPGLQTPFAVALVELDEGVRVVGNVEADPADVHVGLPVEVAFQTVDDDLSLPVWKVATT